MSAKDYAKKIALGTCVYYTAATFFILFFYFLINADLSKGMNPLALISILPFAFCFATANVIYRDTQWSFPARMIIHYILIVGGIFFCLYLPNKTAEQRTGGAILLFLIFSVIYFLIMGTIWIVQARIKRVKRDEAKYHSVYKK